MPARRVKRVRVTLVRFSHCSMRKGSSTAWEGRGASRVHRARIKVRRRRLSWVSKVKRKGKVKITGS